MKFRKVRLVISSARLSGDGSFVDVRYWFSRPDKLETNIKSCLIDEGSKEVIFPAHLYKVGAVKSKHGKYNQSGLILFRNRDQLFRNGSKVTFVLGDYLVKHVEIK